ncbi:hypothetical protein I314_03637 [Cryptococcus bacillisporus CA1873]|uniref:Uncharacterized protein n=1 Tax=Cryptococcus bacillisporus CA1873 TaxID=1296111 RepID=A0ABR5B9U2_CRYGA|nr:hypothetical protein I314_03637 [Cryptococcus bacillisporus CA1873]|eukprot:KIR60346.1 hypothetical protein I314_03637 [Cryptococcus gattii CA1873]
MSMVHPSARLLSLRAPLHPFAVPLRSACARRVGLARRGWAVGGETGGEVEGCDGVDVVGCGRGGDWGQVGVGGRRCTRGLCPCRAGDTHHPVIIPPLASHPIRPPSRRFAVAVAIPIRISDHAVPDVSPVDSALHVCHACGHMAISAATYSGAGDKQERG